MHPVKCGLSEFPFISWWISWQYITYFLFSECDIAHITHPFTSLLHIYICHILYLISNFFLIAGLSTLYISLNGLIRYRLSCGSVSECSPAVPHVPRTTVRALLCSDQTDIETPSSQTRGPGNQDSEQNQAFPSKCACFLCCSVWWVTDTNTMIKHCQIL